MTARDTTGTRTRRFLAAGALVALGLAPAAVASAAPEAPAAPQEDTVHETGRAGAAGATPTTGTTGPLDLDAIATDRYGADAAWFRENIPFVDLPDETITDTYYYRWKAFKEHLRSTDLGSVITEFMPSVSWERKYSTISAASSHQMYEARWLHDTSYVEDYARWWLGDDAAGTPAQGDLRQYTSWIGDALWANYLVSGDASLPTSHLAALEKNVTAWDDHYDASKGLYRVAPTNDATEFTTAGLDVDDGWAGDSFRPTINSYLFADNRAISRIAALTGDDATSATFADRAAELKTRVQDDLWNDDYQQFADRFSSKYPDRYFDFASGPELAGYVPWYFGLPDEKYDVAWSHLRDTEQFAGAAGLRTIYPSSPYYMVQHRTPGASPGECEWNGPSWPFQTSQVLTGLANLIDTRGDASGAVGDVIDKGDYYDVLHQYAAQQRKDGEPYVAENLDPDTGEWIADFPSRSEDYNHSTFADVVLNGLLGVRPQAGDTLELSPLVPDDWDHFALQNLEYHGRDLSVVYDEDGSHYGLGTAGLSVWVDGKLVVEGAPVTGTTVEVHAGDATPAPDEANYAFGDDGAGPAIASASSSTGPGSVSDANDGRAWTREVPVNRWVSDPDDARPWYRVDLPGDVAVSAVVVHSLDDGDDVREPAATRIEYWHDGAWAPVTARVGGTGGPGGVQVTANTATRVGIEPVTTSRIRLAMTAQAGRSVGLTEVEAIGPYGQETTPLLPGVPAGAVRYEAEDAELVGARVATDTSSSGGARVGGIDTAGSSVTFTLDVPEAGTYPLGVRYANGTTSDASHTVSVDGGAATSVGYAPTGGWGDAGKYGVATIDVDLVAGRNTVRFGKGDGFAELDMVFLPGPASAGPSVTVDARARCVGENAYVAVRATSTDDVPLDLTLRTPFGSRTVRGVEPGTSAAQSFNARAGSVVAGSVTVTAVASGGTTDGSTTEVTAEHGAATCS